MQILAFYASMGMRLPDKPPLLLVEPSALESAEVREGRHETISHNSEAPVRQPLHCPCKLGLVTVLQLLNNSVLPKHLLMTHQQILFVALSTSCWQYSSKPRVCPPDFESLCVQVFHTRGMTLSMEYHNVRTVVRNRGSSFFDLRPDVVHIPGRSHCEVCPTWSAVLS